MLCIQSSEELTISGTHNGLEFSFIEILVKQCQNTTTTGCKSQSAIDSYFSDIRVNVYYLNQLMSFLDVDNPVKPYIETPVIMQLLPNLENQATLYIQEAESELLDNFFFYWEVDH